MSWPTHYPTRRERFARWREWKRDRIWRYFHPKEAREQEEARAAMWRKITPALKAATTTMFQHKPAIHASYLTGKLPDRASDEWYYELPVVHIPLRARIRYAVLNAIWAIIEAIPPKAHRGY